MPERVWPGEFMASFLCLINHFRLFRSHGRDMAPFGSCPGGQSSALLRQAAEKQPPVSAEPQRAAFR
ncbi:hypothetical protein, partial [Pantoea ananatis]|uniref:hypothetical protein n=1 Tax=Pantoea ananas TaxID=553 RepID=UPI003FA4AA67